MCAQTPCNMPVVAFWGPSVRRRPARGLRRHRNVWGMFTLLAPLTDTSYYGALRAQFKYIEAHDLFVQYTS